jgi:hypothetical protein
MNLVINASEALAETAGRIEVRIEHAQVTPKDLEGSRLRAEIPGGRAIALHVTDAGHGIDATTLGRIFDPFFTTKSTGRISRSGLPNRARRRARPTSRERPRPRVPGAASCSSPTMSPVPKLSGVEALRRIRAQNADIPVLCTSGYSADKLGSEAETDPHTRFLAKPYSLAELKTAIDALLAQSVRRHAPH